MNRLLSAGGPDSIEWLREEIVATKARGLSYTQVARWVPRSLYEGWIAEDPNRAIWPHA